MEIEADELAEAIPPVEMLLRRDALTYGAILRVAQEQGVSVMETANYRIATDGAFVARELLSKTWHFYFHQLSGADKTPFAITRKLRQPPSC